MNLHVFCPGAAKAALLRLAPGYEAQTGCRLNFTFDTAGGLKAKILAGDTVDVAILTVELLENLPGINPETVIELGRVGVGIAVRSGTILPDLATEKAFRQTLLDAESIVYADPAMGATSGIHFAELANKLGISELLAPKSLRLPGNRVMEAVANGQAALGIQQITEILPAAGVELAGPLPTGLQKITVYGAGVSLSSSTDCAAAFIGFLKSDAACSELQAAGFGHF